MDDISKLIMSRPINYDQIALNFIRERIEFLVEFDDNGHVIGAKDGMQGDWYGELVNWFKERYREDYDSRVEHDDKHINGMLKALKKYCVKCPSSVDQLNDWDNKYNHIVLKPEYISMFPSELHGYVYTIHDDSSDSSEDWDMNTQRTAKDSLYQHTDKHGINWDGVALMFIRDMIDRFTVLDNDGRTIGFTNKATNDDKYIWIRRYSEHVYNLTIDGHIDTKPLDTALSKYLDSDGNLLPEYGWLFAIDVRLF